MVQRSRCVRGHLVLGLLALSLRLSLAREDRPKTQAHPSRNMERLVCDELLADEGGTRGCQGKAFSHPDPEQGLPNALPGN